MADTAAPRPLTVGETVSLLDQAQNPEPPDILLPDPTRALTAGIQPPRCPECGAVPVTMGMAADGDEALVSFDGCGHRFRLLSDTMESAIKVRSERRV